MLPHRGGFAQSTEDLVSEKGKDDRRPAGVSRRGDARIQGRLRERDPSVQVFTEALRVLHLDWPALRQQVNVAVDEAGQERQAVEVDAPRAAGDPDGGGGSGAAVRTTAAPYPRSCSVIQP